MESWRQKSDSFHGYTLENDSQVLTSCKRYIFITANPPSINAQQLAVAYTSRVWFSFQAGRNVVTKTRSSKGIDL
jgi:hypothetical protein